MTKPFIIITGASSGIGAATAKQFSDAGYATALLARNRQAMKKLRIFNVAPAKIKTPLLMSSHLSDDQIIEVEDMAKAILWIYQQPKTVCIRDIVIAPTYYEA